MPNLKKYAAKRELEKTPEPKPVKKRSGPTLHFCVQKHAASHLHYDFRLEFEGVLLSWAVPKGPSLNPSDKRLAIHVEDHPLDYRLFEGTIPKGNYGAGTVLLWDEGTYTPTKEMRAGLKKGHLEFELHGTKLKGKFDLIRLKTIENENSWLLIKGKDEFASKSNILNEDYSVKKKVRKASHTKMPTWISPMLATLVDKAFDHPEWLFEIKLDGYRTLAYVNEKHVQLYSRNKNSFNKLFPTIATELEKTSKSAIFDGEVVVLDAQGRSKFELIQDSSKGTRLYYIFDLLYYDGHDIRQEPLIERKNLLKQIISTLNSPLILYSDHIEGKGIKFFQAASKKNLEGIIGKNKNSSYQSTRSRDWVKVKTSLRQEVVVGGYTAPRGSRQKFGALLLGIYKKGELEYIGHVGGGFNEKSLQEIFKKMQPLIQKNSPFKESPKPNQAVTWVKPKLIAEISFAEWTKANRVRQPIFHGLRLDKKAEEVVQEKPGKEVMNIDEVPLTHVDKLYWKKEKITKGDMLEYYRIVGPYMIPHLQNHPLMMRRFPEGTGRPGFYQKNNETSPAWVQTFLVKHESKNDRYLLIQDLPSLLYVANLGSVELHPMTVQVNQLDYPDFLVVDLDPVEIPFEKVVECALEAHALLDQLKIPNYCKTSGGDGLHIYIPLHAQYSFTQIEPFALLLAHLLQQKLPDLISLERMPSKRKKKVYFDYLQNLHGGRTMVAPYSLRAKPGAPVSTPLKWSEVNHRLDPSAFNIHTLPKRLEKVGDLFKPLLTEKINLGAILKRIEKLNIDPYLLQKD